MPNSRPTARTLVELLIRDLVGIEGGDRGRWAEIVGAVHVLSGSGPAEWAVVPGGLPRERQAIGRSVERVRRAHPTARR